VIPRGLNLRADVSEHSVYSNFIGGVILLTAPMKMEEKDVPKRRYIKFRRRGITLKKEYNEIEDVERFRMSCNKLLFELVGVREVYDLTLAN
jgi:hypothetical protein